MKRDATARVAVHPRRQRVLHGPSAQSEMVAGLVVVAAAVVFYLLALRNGFVWDDPLVLEQLRAMHGWRDLVVMPPQVPRFYYRPLIFVTYLVDRALGGETPFWFHFSVVAFHALNCLLVFRLADQLFRGDVAIAAAAGLLFAVLPTHVESVAWMAGRSDVIVCTFLLLTIVLSIRRAAVWTAWAGGITFLLALLSKELAVAGLLIVPACDWLSTRRLYWTRYAPLVLATIVYFALRHGSLGEVVGGAPASAPPDQLVLDLVRAAGFYLARTLVPFGLSPYVAAVPESPIYLAAGVVLPIIIVAVLYRAWPQARWPAAFLVAWFVATLVPSLTVILRTSASAPLADRYLYVPSVATCILAGWGISAAIRRRRLATGFLWAIVAGLTLVFGVTSAIYSQVWTDDVSFWTKVTQDLPANGLAWRELGSAQIAVGRLDDAEGSLQRALSLPLDTVGRTMTYSQLGLVYRRRGGFADAVGVYESALALARHPTLYHNLGMTLMAKAESDQRQGDTAAVLDDVRRARAAFETALSLEAGSASRTFLEQWDPAKTHALLGQVLISLNDKAGAREHLETALRLEPTGPVADVSRRQLERIR